VELDSPLLGGGAPPTLHGAARCFVAGTERPCSVLRGDTYRGRRAGATCTPAPGLGNVASKTVTIKIQ
jgi:hypothetical protein